MRVFSKLYIYLSKDACFAISDGSFTSDACFLDCSATHNYIAICKIPTHAIPSNKPLISATHFEDKKYNIVMYGIKESSPKTYKSNHLENDLQSILQMQIFKSRPVQLKTVFV